MPDLCQLCKDAGRNIEADRPINGIPVCRFHSENTMVVRKETGIPQLTEKLESDQIPISNFHFHHQKGEMMSAKKQVNIEAMKRDYAAGMSGAELAKKYAVSAVTALNRLKEAGVKLRSRSESLRGKRGPWSGRKPGPSKVLNPKSKIHLNAPGVMSELEEVLNERWAAMTFEQKLAALQAAEN